MTHLAPEELIDAVDGVLVPARRGHLDTCDTCREQLTSLRAVMHDVRATNVPEPSPLFWDRLASRVRQAVDEEAAPPSQRWFRWPVLAPLGALALLVIALVASMGDQTSVVPGAEDVVAVDDTSTPPATLEDFEDQWAMLADLVADLDMETANAEGIVAPLGAADAAVWRLSSVEQEELARLLREELRAGG